MYYMQKTREIRITAEDRKVLAIMQRGDMIVPKTSRVGHKVGLPSSTTHIKLKELEKEGYIKGYLPILDAEKLGRGFVVYIFGEAKSIQVDYDKAAEEVAKMPEVQELYFVAGTRDFVVKLRVSNEKEYYDVAKEIFRKFGQRSEGLIALMCFRDRFTFEVKTEKLKETERKILNILQTENLLLPRVTKIATELKMPVMSVYERIKRLERDGIIKGYSVWLDGQKLEAGFVSYVLLGGIYGSETYSPDFIAGKLSTWNEAEELYELSGEYNFLMKVRVKDRMEYAKVAGKMGTVLPKGILGKGHISIKFFKDDPRFRVS
jgi:Lrp/AsnC family leucine-responsive transcriptional regulator